MDHSIFVRDGEDPREHSEKHKLPEVIPSIVEGHGKKLLYIGASKSRMYMGEELRDCGYLIDVLEIWPENFEHIKNTYTWLNKVVLGDVRKIEEVINENYDVIVWWHGPEHIEKDALKNTLDKLEKISKLVVLGCPLGQTLQLHCDWNPHEDHLWEAQPEDFEKFGYNTKVFDRLSGIPHITSWKFV